MPTDQSGNVFSAAIRNAILSLMLLLLVACGGGGAGSSSNNVALQVIAIAPTNPSQQLGKKLQLVATGTYSDGTTRDVSSTVTWSSSKTSVATISASGLLSTVTIGTSMITATLGGITSGATLTVTSGPAIESILYQFGTTASDGVQPSGSLLQAIDGDFYGTTGAGGVNSCLSQPNFCGTVFKVTPTGVETVLHSFSASTPDGWDPTGLVQASDGNFYGTTGRGGTHGAGTVFKITPGGVETILYSFGASPSDGATPVAALIQASDGNFYGTTAAGGANSCLGVPNFCGTIFKITPAGVETVLYSFGASASDGVEPQGSLIQARDGNFYGTTSYGGANSCGQYSNSCGTVFKVTPAGVETILYSFGASRSDGYAPLGALIEASDGSLYGTTASGGNYSCPVSNLNGCGTVFKITPAGMENVLYAFGASATDGSGPTPFLIQATDGNLYGTTVEGGENCSGVCGTVFEVTLAGIETVLYSFGASQSDGSDPVGMIQASDGNFYGVTFRAGSLDSGTVFKLVP
jgi:uncharacterized repeat protein (TIGR03803 family)